VVDGISSSHGGSGSSSQMGRRPPTTTWSRKTKSLTCVASFTEPPSLLPSLSAHTYKLNPSTCFIHNGASGAARFTFARQKGATGAAQPNKGNGLWLIKSMPYMPICYAREIQKRIFGENRRRAHTARNVWQGSHSNRLVEHCRAQVLCRYHLVLL
jgi:hypothetical protein